MAWSMKMCRSILPVSRSMMAYFCVAPIPQSPLGSRRGVWIVMLSRHYRAVGVDLPLHWAYACCYEKRCCMGRLHYAMAEHQALEVLYGYHTEPYHCPSARQGSVGTVFCRHLWSDV